MRWLVVGGGGLLGTDAVHLIRGRGHTVSAPARQTLDITDPDSCRRATKCADVVLNCAGWTDVDAAEGAEEAAFAANAVGAAHLSRAAREEGARMVHISTDYVFDGTAREPYPEDAPLAPCSAYGRSKAAGEWAVRAEAADFLIVRTAWLYGRNGRCFPRTIMRLAKERPTFSVVDDQWGQPTWTVDVVDMVARLVEQQAPRGIYHATASGRTTWFEFAREAMATGGHDPQRIEAVGSDGYPTRADRPAFSVLGHATLERQGLQPIGDWRDRWKLAAERVLG